MTLTIIILLNQDNNRLIVGGFFLAPRGGSSFTLRFLENENIVKVFSSFEKKRVNLF